MHNFVDTTIAQFFNQFVHRSQVIDALVFQVAQNHLFKCAVLFSIICVAWFKVKIVDLTNKKKAFLTIFLVATLAMIIARTIAFLSPHRYRPIYDTSLHLNAPFSVNHWFLNGWSSFPSDHAALFFAISFSIYFLHKRLGLLAIGYTVLCICFPRLLLGLHFLTDLIAGALIGILVARIGFKYFIQSKLVAVLIGYSEKKPEYFYTIFLFFIYQLYEMLEGVRRLIPILRWALKVILVRFRILT
jgi:undecaprenyl-diphosphatase